MRTGVFLSDFAGVWTRGSLMTGDGDLGGRANESPEMDRSKALSSSSDDRSGVAGARLLRNCDASASKTASSSVDSLESSWKAEGGGVQASCWLGRVSSNKSCSTSVILSAVVFLLCACSGVHGPRFAPRCWLQCRDTVRSLLKTRSSQT